MGLTTETTQTGTADAIVTKTDIVTQTDAGWSELWKDENVKEYKEALFDRIAEQLITKFTELEIHVGSLKSLQKTIRDKELQIGIQSEDEQIVIYQSDTEANYEDKQIMDQIVSHFGFKHPMNINLEIQSFTSDTGDIPSSISIVLKHPDVSDLNINDLLGELELQNLKIKDNVSQFIEIPKTKTYLNFSKIPEYTETTFTEIKPEIEESK